MSLPYFPMFPSDFEAKTSHLTLEEDGAYNRLLRLMWMTPGCSLPDDDQWIMRRMRVDEDTFRRVVLVVIDEFCIRKNGRVSNAKLTQVFDESKEKHERRVLAGSRGGKAKALRSKEKQPSNAKAKLKQPKPEPEPNIGDTNVSLLRDSPDRFDDFWNQYPHRGGAKKGRKPSEQKFKAALKSGATPEQIIAGAIRYAEDSRVIAGYAKDPATWLNQRGWEDEIEPASTINGTGGNGRASGSGDSMVDAFARVAARRAGTEGGGGSCH